jgi:HSP20 family molecular chaperone IbpA
MNRLSLFSSPLFLGFDRLEEMLDRVSRVSSDGYPPYNVESTGDNRLRITLAVAGFERDELAITVENNELIVRGKQADDGCRVFLHRGIAARQFQRRFVLAEGVDVRSATLGNGLLHIDLVQPEPATVSRTIDIKVAGETQTEVSGRSNQNGSGQNAAAPQPATARDRGEAA